MAYNVYTSSVMSRYVRQHILYSFDLLKVGVASVSLDSDPK